MTYQELKDKQAKEFSNFPIGFAFNDKQLKRGMEKLGVTNTDELTSIGAGGFIRKADKQAFIDMTDNQEKELTGALQDDEFLQDAIEYEMANHEYCITYDDEEVLGALGISEIDARIAKIYLKAKKHYLEFYEEM